MKKLLLFISILTFTYSFATIKTTVANGEWFDANNWSPAGVPINEDTVVINHIITVNDDVDYGATWMIVENSGEIIADSTFALHGNYKGFGNLTARLFAVGDGDSTLMYGSINGDKFAVGNPINLNFGSIYSDTLSIGADFENSGLIDVTMFSFGASSFINNSGAAIVVSAYATFGNGNSVNEAEATIVTTELATNDDFENNGDVSTSNWTHGAGVVSGSTGRFCIDNCFVNNATITGTVDVCDATPNGVCDFNMGTIDATVTNCTSGPCGNNVGVEEEEEISINVYPNPARDHITIEGVSKGSELIIYSITGQVVKQKLIENESSLVDVSNLNKGAYIVTVAKFDHTEILRLIIQ